MTMIHLHGIMPMVASVPSTRPGAKPAGASRTAEEIRKLARELNAAEGEKRERKAAEDREARRRLEENLAFAQREAERAASRRRGGAAGLNVAAYYEALNAPGIHAGGTR
jgi:hypothetical protein